MQILLANDDGIHSPGLRALCQAASRLGDVQVVAPLTEQSGVSHRITYLHPILAREILENDGGHYGWAVDGSPADCVKLGILEFCPRRPSLVLSGINSGANVGINVKYSGTVAAAMEGAIFGITSIAISLAQRTPPDYVATAERAITLVEQLLEQAPEGTLWNINFPDTTPAGPKGVRVCSMAVKRRSERVDKRTDPRGRPYYWSGLDPISGHELEPGSDVRELSDGYVTVTPLQFDLTERHLLQQTDPQRLRL